MLSDKSTKTSIYAFLLVSNLYELSKAYKHIISLCSPKSFISCVSGVILLTIVNLKMKINIKDTRIFSQHKAIVLY